MRRLALPLFPPFSRFLAHLALLALLALLAGALPGASPAQAMQAETVDEADVAKRVQAFAAFGDRGLGGKGVEDAARYLESYFRGVFAGWDNATAADKDEEEEAGFRLGRQRFGVPVQALPRDKQAWLARQDTGKAVSPRPLRANVLSPGAIPAPGLEGRLLYVAKGEVKDFNGLDVAGAIVLMDLDSGNRWRHAAALGARAVVYLDDPSFIQGGARWQFEDKLELTPVDFPRLWLPRQEAQAWLERELSAPADLGTAGLLVSPMRWRLEQADNLFAFLPGSDPALRDEVLVVEAFFDATAHVPGQAPGADESASAVALMHVADRLAASPPRRSVLLLASNGHAQHHAGLREFYGALEAPGREFRKRQQEIKRLANEVETTRELLEAANPLALAANSTEAALVLEACQNVVKTEVDQISTRLMRLRLESAEMAAAGTGMDPADEIRRLAEERLSLRRLLFLRDMTQAGEADRARLRQVLPRALAEVLARERDVKAQNRAIKGAQAIKGMLGGKTIKAHVSLHLSSRGDGIGAFDRGFLVDLRQDVNRSRYYTQLDELLRRLRQEQTAAGLPDLLRDTLRPSRLRTWESWLPDQPDMGGEVAALAGVTAITLATVHDGRPYWGTPHDIPEHVDMGFLARQIAVVGSLVESLAAAPMPWEGREAPNGFGFLAGRANLLRQGELFPDRPADGAVVCCFQGLARYMGMVDSLGQFRIAGLADAKTSQHKAVLEVFKFDPETGRVLWTVDKAATGLKNYRVKMSRRAMETQLTLFTCSQIDLFQTLEPRSFRHMTIPSLFDGRTETLPLRYWYSRLDTRSSTVNAVFLEPGVPMKLAMSDTVLGRKMLLLNATAERPTGRGFLAGETARIPATEYQAARDMWTLVAPRVENLEARGIVNERVRELMDHGLAALRQAEGFLAAKEYDRFLDSARTAWALASRVYNDVDRTTKDVLIGVLFYVALFAPFAYCLERLLFGFTHIHRRILGFLGVLLVTIAVIHAVHPAFHLTYSPLVVILAFFILGLSLLVAAIIFFRFEREMVDLQRRSQHLKATEMSKAGAFGAAFVLGVSNLRRRPVRTALTCATLVILTFTIMNFTAVKSVRQQTATRFGDAVPYPGILLKHFGWQDLPHEALDAMRDALADRGEVTPRVWYVTQDRGRPPVIPVHADGREAEALGALGLSHREPAVTGLDRILVRGRWLEEGEKDAVLLPRRMAELLDVDPETPGRNQVRIWGMEFRVAGLFDHDRLRASADLDGESLTPVFYPRETVFELSDQEAEALDGGGGDGGESGGQQLQSRYEHVAEDRVIIMPHARLLSISKGGGGLGGGGRLKSLAFRPDQAPGAGEDVRSLAASLADRFGMMLFFAQTETRDGERPGSYLFYAGESLSYAGAPNILIPLLISACIVLNTMIGSVFERKREIAVYTSVGLAPVHVAFLFMAEALAFAVISVVVGYLLAQGAAAVLAGTSLWAGMTANYSSLAGVAAMALVMLVVLVSTLYPARMAASIAIPDVNRSWNMPATEGDTLDVTLPFLVKLHEMATAGGFLTRYFQAHEDVTHGAFSVADLDLGFRKGGELPSFVPEDVFREDVCFSMEMRVWLAPFDFGVRQRARLVFCPSTQYPGFREIKIRLTREAGEHGVWWNLNKGFLNGLRKQLLVWRSLEEPARRDCEQSLSRDLRARDDGAWRPKECFLKP